MCNSGAFFLPTALPLAALLGTGALLCLAVLGSVLWFARAWLTQRQASALPFIFPPRESREYTQGYPASEPKQEYEQPQEMPPQW